MWLRKLFTFDVTPSGMRKLRPAEIALIQGDQPGREFSGVFLISTKWPVE